MKQEAHEILKTCLANHRDLVLGGKTSCLGVMKDYGGREHPEINLLAEALEERIPDRLEGSQPVTAEIITTLASQFAAKKFFTKDMAEFAVQSWADALGFWTLDSSIFTNDANQKATNPSAKVESQSKERAWHYSDGTTTLGPVSESQITSLIKTGEINANMQVWSEGMIAWEEASKYFLIISPPPKTISSPLPDWSNTSQQQTGAHSCPLCNKAWNKEITKELYGKTVCKKCYYSFANKRQFACFLDCLIYYFINTIINTFLLTIGFPEAVLWIIGSIVFTSKDCFSGKSIGKAILGLKVIDTRTGEPPSALSSFKRNLPLNIPFAAIFISSQLLKGHRTGDKWSNTKVVWSKYANNPIFGPDLNSM